jgi:glutathione S-transferase
MTVISIYNPQSRAVMTLWLLEELGVSYDLKPVAYEDGSMRTSGSFLALNPMGKIPAIVDGETVVTETVAIAMYLADKYKANADLAPAIDDPRRGEYLRWIVFQAACD